MKFRGTFATFLLLLSACTMSSSETLTIGVPTPTLALLGSTPTYSTNLTFRVTNLDIVSGSITLYADGNCSSSMGSVSFPSFTAYADLLMVVASPGTGTLSVKTSYASGTSACSNAVTVTVLPPPTPSSMAMASSYTNPGYTGAPTVVVSGVSSGLTVRVYSDGSCSTQVGTASAFGASVNVNLTGLAVGSTPLYAKTINSSSLESPCSGLLMTYLREAPPIPSGISLVGGSNPSFRTDPLVQVAGVANGLTVRVYKDAACTTQVGNGTASGTTVNFWLSNLTLGSNTLYARTENSGTQSSCSAMLLDYVVGSPVVPSSIAMESSYINPSYSTSTYVRVSGVGDGLTVRVYSDAACTTQVGWGLAYSSTHAVSISGMAMGANSLYAKTELLGAQSACSSELLVYTVLAPLPPSAIGMNGSYTNPGYVRDPTIRVFGVAVGTRALIYSDAACTTLLATSSYASSGTEVWPSLSSLPLGLTALYAKTENSIGTKSACSGLLMTYQLNATQVSSVTLDFPASTTHYSSQVELLTASLPTYSQVKFYLDSACSTTVVGSGTASPASAIKVSGLPTGTHTFYSKIDASTSVFASACTSTGVTYTVAPRVSFASAIVSSTSNTVGRSALQDFNEDGKVDAVVPQNGSVGSSPLRFYAGNGDGTFQSPVLISNVPGATDAVAADFNFDSHLDVAVISKTNRTVSIFLGAGNGTFSLANTYSVGSVSSPPLRAVAANLNSDGVLDLAVVTGGPYEASTLQVLISQGGGSFAAPVSYAAEDRRSSIGVADLDGDGDMDIALGGDYIKGLNIFKGTGSGTFAASVPYTFDSSTGDIVLVDMNSDGKIDVVGNVTHSGSEVVISMNPGDGTFSTKTAYKMRNAGFLFGFNVDDIDGDGHPDAFASTYMSSTDQVIISFGNASGVIDPFQGIPSGGNGRIVQTADFNGDGKLDIFVTYSSSGFGVLKQN